jgi:predicted lipoprotein with Yx(FWY)xxD motif
MTKTLTAIAVLAVAALAVVGCGSSNSSSSNENGGGGAYGSGQSSATTTKAAAAPTSGGAVVSATGVGNLGKVLVDSKGFTLYDFHKDKGTTSSCYGACAQSWPPLLTEGKPQAGEGAMASKLGTTNRNDGTTQVTYAGRPMYTFVEDKKPGEANGNDVSAFGGQWYALKPSGEEAGG